MYKLLCSSFALALFFYSLSIAETQENYLATLQELDKAKKLCEVISIDEEAHDAFSLQMTVIDIQIRSLDRPIFQIDDQDEVDLFNNIELSQLNFSIADTAWGTVIVLTGLEDQQEAIDFWISEAEKARATAILYLDGAWESYNKMDFDGDSSDDDDDGDSDGSGGGGGGGGGCFINTLKNE